MLLPFLFLTVSFLGELCATLASLAARALDRQDRKGVAKYAEKMWRGFTAPVPSLVMVKPQPSSV